MCKYTPGLVDPYLNLAITPMKVKFDVEIVYGNFTCGACTEEPTCQLWHPDPRGNYQPFCSMTAYVPVNIFVLADTSISST